MSDINIYPFTRKIVLEQKTQEEQKALLDEANKDVNPLVTPADYTPVYTTDKPIAGVTDDLSSMKPSISVVEETPTSVQAKAQESVKTASQPRPLVGTIVTTAIIVVVGYFLYKKLDVK